MKTKFGYEPEVWEKAKREATEKLIEVAKRRGRIAYSELTAYIQAIQFDADDPRYWEMLGEISIEEAKQNRGMLSCLVVHRSGDMRPGPGFYKLAKYLGKQVNEVDRFWLNEFNRVHDIWANQKSRNKQNT